ncbi:ATP-binding cassette domain-containing protein, partial [Streptomyces hokutonensis]|uniref:ATP-binding cassette domain-containing protein n=1 Tax=Streptomyces hokutonensis TaxID=1306990 RepID=UPI0033D22D88
ADSEQTSGTRNPQGHTAGTGQQDEADSMAAAHRSETGPTAPTRKGVARPAETNPERTSGDQDSRGRTARPGQRDEADSTAATHRSKTGPTAATRRDVARSAQAVPGRASRARDLRGRTAPTRTPPALTAHALYARYGSFIALDGVDLVVRAGQVTAVVGPNGAGKSTLFHCLAGTVRPVRGRVRLGGRDITRLPAHARTRLGVGRTFQQLAVFPSLTVAENVRVGAEQGRVAEPGSVERALRLFGLDGELRSLPAAGLPTGTLRRVELARAFAGSPRVLLLDEPAAGLDTAEVAALALVLRALAAEGTALLVVEHDLDLVADLADVVHVMTAGRIVASGPPDRVLDTPSAWENPA